MSDEPKEPVVAGGEMIFEQDGDSINDTPQSITISVQDAGGGKFYVIETERWAFDNITQLIKLAQKAEAAFMANESTVGKADD